MEVRYFAGAAEAAGRQSEIVDATGLSVSELIVQIAGANEHLGEVVRAAVLLADGVRVDSPEQDLSEVKQLDVLPPFAGG